jgi:glycosyltransferase involved in cell wall biosynthesis
MTKNNPFFSILIPTKNRHHIVDYAIKSVLNQTFSDFEVILMDNSDNEDTFICLSKYNDPRVKYFRTGGLNMAENWQKALIMANGTYITVLEDKHAYYKNALSIIIKQIKDRGAKIIVFEWDRYDDNKNKSFYINRSGNINNSNSRELLRTYVSSVRNGTQFIPRMLNSFVHKDVISDSIEKKQTYFFSEMSPDLMAAFAILSIDCVVLHMDKSLGIGGYASLSNANKMRLNNFSYYGKMTTENALKNVEIKSKTLTYNTVYNDYLERRGQLAGNLSFYSMTDYMYLAVCVWDVLRFYKQTHNIQRSLKEIANIFRYLNDGRFHLYLAIPIIVLSNLTLAFFQAVWIKYRTTSVNSDNLLESTLIFDNDF